MDCFCCLRRQKTMNERQEIDFLIVGQGLAGTLLSHILLANSRKISILDELKTHTSSRVAAGLFHPVTGRRIVKSWMVDVLYDFASNFYAEQEKQFQTKFFFPKELLEVLSSTHEFNVWSERLGDPSISRYLAEQPPIGMYETKLKKFFKMISMKGSGWMDIAKYLELSFKHFSNLDIIESGKFDINFLEIENDRFKYKNYSAKNIIFCEGSDAVRNNLWKWIPFLPSKGEVITISAPTLPEKYILLKGLFLIPLGEQRFRVGSTYTWTYQNELPSEEGLENLKTKLQSIIDVPFDIIDHRSAVRPTTKDRRPIIGEHPKFKNMFIFNGLGTKGVLLGPYFANEFVQFLLNGKSLNPEVNIKRFRSFFPESSETF